MSDRTTIDDPLSKNLYSILRIEDGDSTPSDEHDESASTEPEDPPSDEHDESASTEPEDPLIDYDTDGNEVFKWEVDAFNVDEFEAEYGNKPIFTRALLHYISEKINDALSSLQRGESTKLLYDSPSSDGIAHGKGVVVGEVHGGKNYDDITVCVRYLSRVEMHPEFQKLDRCTDSVELLRTLNRDPKVPHESEWLPAPFVLQWILRDKSTDHEDASKMEQWRKWLRWLKELWQDSVACKQIRDALLEAPGKNVSRIRRIVCFGLGFLQFDPEQRELQHLTAFDIAELCDSINQEEDPSTPNVEVFLQDPMYQAKDRVLLSELRPGIKFVQDPDGLLAIDEHTLVIATFVPINFPLMQIIADAFGQGKGPVGFLVDNLKRRCKEPGMYKANDRLSPGAVHMLKDYQKRPHNSKREDLGEKILKTMGTRGYWMDQMGLWMRDVEKSAD